MQKFYSHRFCHKLLDFFFAFYFRKWIMTQVILLYENLYLFQRMTTTETIYLLIVGVLASPLLLSSHLQFFVRIVA